MKTLSPTNEGLLNILGRDRFLEKMLRYFVLWTIIFTAVALFAEKHATKEHYRPANIANRPLI